MEKYPPDIIFHLARFGGSNNLTRYFASQKGAKANHRLIKFLRGLKSPPKLVYVSGSLMYGHQLDGKSADEFSELNPISFGRHYITGERPWMDAQRNQLLDIRFARPGWIVGPDSWFKAFYWNHFTMKGKIPLYGDGNQLMSLVYVDDCAGQIVNLAENGETRQNLNIFSGNPVSQHVFARTLAALLNAELDFMPTKSLERKFGQVVGEAFDSSIPLSTHFPDLSGRYENMYPDAETMLRKTISLFENKEGVLSKLPQKSSV
jgi:nucleoside-diphosphate-sugar epimerase